MPYTFQQCIKFALMARRGERVPKDWRKHCKGKKLRRQKSTKK